MRGARRFAPAALALLLLLFFFGRAVHTFYRGEPPAGSEAKRVEIPPGASFREISALLEREGIVSDSRWVFLAGRFGGADRRVQAGLYRLVPGTPGGRLLRLLQTGPNEVVRVTIPEGLRLVETAGVLSAELGAPAAEFVRLATDPALVESLAVPGPTLEGYLFPDTYLFFANEPPARVLRRMVETWRMVFDAASAARAAAIGLSPREAITLASIVESEAVVAEERPRISAVYHNRLRLGWKLQADPTVQYALGNRERLLLPDLECDSPYNTYRYAGLPPGPICSPGRASIEAALHPRENSRELYFVASGRGGTHLFSSTLEEHGRAKRVARPFRDSP
jgi:UPF0755 protein